jgi:hypothetical protein
VTWPFCVKHHINVHLDVLVMFIKNNAWKKLITHELPYYVWWPKIELVAIRLAIKIFNHQILITTIDYHNQSPPFIHQNQFWLPSNDQNFSDVYQNPFLVGIQNPFWLLTTIVSSWWQPNSRSPLVTMDKTQQLSKNILHVHFPSD